MHTVAPSEGICLKIFLAFIMSSLNTSWVSREKGEADMADWGLNEREIVNYVLLSVCSNKHQAKNVIAQFQEFLFYHDVIHCVSAFKKLDQEGKFV